MTLNSLGKLRKNLREWVGTDRWETLGTQAEFDALADEIEAEIEETEAFCKRVEEAAKNNDELDVFGVAYMPLPMDADGVPIRVGDILERVDGGPSQQACCICPQGFNDAPIWCARDFRHAKPRTLEDVLEELEGLRGYGNSTYEDVVTRAAELADEIRELMEVH